jgi:hypothetical protein
LLANDEPGDAAADVDDGSALGCVAHDLVVTRNSAQFWCCTLPANTCDDASHVPLNEMLT